MPGVTETHAGFCSAQSPALRTPFPLHNSSPAIEVRATIKSNGPSVVHGTFPAYHD
ncbi:hypothetical protein PISMIDRAFT_676650, partial [Pisolithus microcarpus 441]